MSTFYHIFIPPLYFTQQTILLANLLFAEFFTFFYNRIFFVFSSKITYTMAKYPFRFKTFSHIYNSMWFFLL